MQAAFSGPLPPPVLLEKYEQICPGAADRILKQWETQTEHRQGLENRAVDSNIANSRRGQVFAFILALVTLGIAVWLITIGRSTQGLAVIIGEITTLALVFITGRRKENRELAAKRGPIEHASQTIQRA